MIVLRGRRRAGRARRRSGRSARRSAGGSKLTWNIVPQSPADAPAREPPHQLVARHRRAATTASSAAALRRGARPSASACATVRGKPSRMKPRCASAAASRSLDDADHDLVGHEAARRPCSAAPRVPSGVPRADRLAQDVAGRDVRHAEPLARAASPASPCPPRAARSDRRTGASASAILAAGPGCRPRFMKPFVAAGDQVRLHRRDRVERDADDDQQRGAAEEERHVELRDQDGRQDADRRRRRARRRA